MKRYLVVCILSISLALTACGASTPEEATTSDVDTVEVDTNLASKDSIDVPSNLIEDKEETKETEDVVDSTNESKENEVDMEAASSDSKVTEVDEDTQSNTNTQANSHQNTVNNQDVAGGYDVDGSWWGDTITNSYITSLKFPTISYTEGTGNGPGANWVKGFDYENLNIGPNEEEFWEMKYWDTDLESLLTTYTASNGITLKVVKNQFADASMYKYYPIIDGKGADLLPGSPYMVAVDEATVGRSDISQAINSDLSFTMPVTSYKRDSVDVNDSNLLALKASMDASYTQATGGYLDVEYMFMEPDAIYLRDSLNANPIIIERKGDYWEVTFLINPAKNLWSWTLNTLKFIDPNAQSIYNEMYHHMYEGSDLAPDYNTWYNVNGTQMMVVNTTGTGTVIFRFK